MVCQFWQRGQIKNNCSRFNPHFKQTNFLTRLARAKKNSSCPRKTGVKVCSPMEWARSSRRAGQKSASSNRVEGKVACGTAFDRFAIPLPISSRISYCHSQPSLGHFPRGGRSSVQIKCLPHSGQLIFCISPIREG